MSVCLKPETKCEYRVGHLCTPKTRFKDSFTCLQAEKLPKTELRTKRKSLPQSDNPNKYWDVKEGKFKMRKPKTAEQARLLALGPPRYIRSSLPVDASTRLLIRQQHAAEVPILKAKVETIETVNVSKVKVINKQEVMQ